MATQGTYALLKLNINIELCKYSLSIKITAGAFILAERLGYEWPFIMCQSLSGIW